MMSFPNKKFRKSQNTLIKHVLNAGGALCCLNHQIDMGDISSLIQQGIAGEILLPIEVQPGASKSGLKGVNTWRGRLQIAVRSQPKRGAANDEVIQVLSKSLSVKKSNLTIVAGVTSRQKTMKIENAQLEDIQAKLTEILEVNENESPLDNVPELNSPLSAVTV